MAGFEVDIEDRREYGEEIKSRFTFGDGVYVDPTGQVVVRITEDEGVTVDFSRRCDGILMDGVVPAGVLSFNGDKWTIINPDTRYKLDDSRRQALLEKTTERPIAYFRDYLMVSQGDGVRVTLEQEAGVHVKCYFEPTVRLWIERKK